jgi:hypothetical protein
MRRSVQLPGEPLLLLFFLSGQLELQGLNELVASDTLGPCGIFRSLIRRIVFGCSTDLKPTTLPSILLAVNGDFSLELYVREDIE